MNNTSRSLRFLVLIATSPRQIGVKVWRNISFRGSTYTIRKMLAAAGCQVSIITDSPVIPQEYLPLCAGLAVQAGMDPFAALQAITINPARHAGIADRVGSIEVGKDADLVITDGCPFEVSTKVRHVFIEGKEVQ